MQENLGKANEKSNLRKDVRQMCAAQSPEILYHSPTFPFHCITHTINSQFLTHKNLRKTKLVSQWQPYIIIYKRTSTFRLIFTPSNNNPIASTSQNHVLTDDQKFQNK